MLGGSMLGPPSMGWVGPAHASAAPMSWWEEFSLCTPYPSPPTKPYESAPPSPKIPGNHSRVIASYLWKVANFNLPQLHLASSLGVTPFEFCPDLQHQKTSLPGLLCGVACVILRLAFSEEHQLVTDADLGTMKKNSGSKIFNISGHFSGHIMQWKYNQSKPNKNKYIMWMNSEIMTWNFLY